MKKDDDKLNFYNPKEFRSVNNRRDEKFSKSSLFLFVIGFLCIIAAADFFTKGELYSMLNSGKNSLIEKDFTKINDGGGENKKPCARGDYVSMDDISLFKKHADILLQEIAKVEANFRTTALTEVEKIDEYNKVVLNAKGIISFYNEKLIKCYKSSASSRDVQALAGKINKSLSVVKDLINK